jgi:F0F1-type ATP synthase epsilon subunit
MEIWTVHISIDNGYCTVSDNGLSILANDVGYGMQVMVAIREAVEKAKAEYEVKK